MVDYLGSSDEFAMKNYNFLLYQLPHTKKKNILLADGEESVGLSNKKSSPGCRCPSNQDCMVDQILARFVNEAVGDFFLRYLP